MAGMGAAQAPTTGAAPKTGGGGLILAVVYVTALFFIWAFVTNLIDPLVKSMKVIYTLTDFETQLNQFAFFIAYGIMSIPSAAYLAKNGYAKSIVLGLSGIVLGCLIAWSTTFSHNFITVLLGLFVAASGITLLQVAANPLIASMGDPKGSHFRLNLSQAFNSMGAYAGGIFGASFLLKGPLFEKDVVVTEAMKATGLGFVTNVYLLIAVILAFFTLAVFLVRNTITHHAPKMAEHAESPFKALQSKWANLGSLGIFLYVGAEVCVISGMIFFLEQKQILNVPSQVAGFVGPIFMLFAMFGRFGGSVLLRYVKATTMLGIVAACATGLCALVIATYHMPATPLGGSVHLPGDYIAPLTMGFIPGIAAILIGLFNSIMFPTIFTITLERSSAPASATSGLMCMAICGGGFISIVYGATVDAFIHHFPVGARSLAFIVPLICYLYVLWFSFAARGAKVHEIQEDAVASGH
ncbi:MFS transporter [Caulobacter sp. BE254]|uniref:MFS transporter n=1 Tax=Caulobacter sp. BE254 TaxID=2817720 RepID=UPI00286511CA|nr:MFS transporter [Caulobacter sp. BE254]MDR7117941.1 FHS family L-fucose permease-like MFS transporter [Caulobacter sp. BE254]